MCVKNASKLRKSRDGETAFFMLFGVMDPATQNIGPTGPASLDATAAPRISPGVNAYPPFTGEKTRGSRSTLTDLSEFSTSSLGPIRHLRRERISGDSTEARNTGLDCGSGYIGECNGPSLESMLGPLQTATVRPDQPCVTFSVDVSYPEILKMLFASEFQDFMNEAVAESTAELRNKIAELEREHRCKDERIEDLRRALDSANRVTKLAMNKAVTRETALLCCRALSSDPLVQHTIDQTLNPVV